MRVRTIVYKAIYHTSTRYREALLRLPEKMQPMVPVHATSSCYKRPRLMCWHILCASEPLSQWLKPRRVCAKKQIASCNFRNSEAFALCILLLLRLLRFALTRLCTGKLYRSFDKAGSRSGLWFIGCSYLNQLLIKPSGDL